MNRREFLKISALGMATTVIKLNIPYQLPHWKDIANDGKWHLISYRWGNGNYDLRVDQTPCDPGNDFISAMPDGRTKAGFVLIEKPPNEGTVTFWIKGSGKNTIYLEDIYLCDRVVRDYQHVK